MPSAVLSITAGGGGGGWASNPRNGVGAVLRCRGNISAKAGLIVIVDCL